MATIQEVYIALFGRPADPFGLAFYNEQTDNGQNLDAVGALSGSPEYLNRFEGMNDVQMVNQIFQDLFGRDADASGLTYYVNLLRSGQASVQDIAVRIIDGATGSDQEVVDAKVAAANLFTASLNDGDEIVAYSGDAGIAFGQAYLDQVQSADDVPSQAEVDAQIAAFVDNNEIPGGNNGPTFTLTTGVDNLVGTAAGDTFQGIVSATTAATVNTFDAIDGGAGVDTLNLVVRGGTIAGPLNISNVEIVNLISTPVAGGSPTPTIADLDASIFGEELEQLWQVNNAASVSGLTEGQTAGFRNTAVDTAVGVAVAAGVTSSAVALENAGDDTEITFTGANLNSVSVSGSIRTTGLTDADLENGRVGLVVDVTNGAAGASEVTTLNLNLSTNVDLSIEGSDSLTTIDASASTGGISLDATGAAAESLDLTSASFGSGIDIVGVALDSFDAAAVSVNLGAGNDVIVIDGSQTGSVAADLTALSVTLGAGRDVVTITDLANLITFDATANTVTQSAIIITDFNASEDVLNLSDLGVTGFFATQNLVDTAASNASANGGSLADVLAAIDDFATATEAVQFDFGGNTYVYVEGGADANDGLIQINGDVALTGTNVLFADAAAQNL